MARALALFAGALLVSCAPSAVEQQTYVFTSTPEPCDGHAPRGEFLDIVTLQRVDGQLLYDSARFGVELVQIHDDAVLIVPQWYSLGLETGTTTDAEVHIDLSTDPPTMRVNLWMDGWGCAFSLEGQLQPASGLRAPDG